MTLPAERRGERNSNSRGDWDTKNELPFEFGGREWGYVLCEGAMHPFTLCNLWPRQMVWLSRRVCVCDMQILLGLHAYLSPPPREYSCSINILLMMECVCVYACMCVCMCVCVCVCVCLCVCQVPAVNSLRPFRRAQAFINKRSSNATFVWAEVTQAPQCISSLPFPPLMSALRKKWWLFFTWSLSVTLTERNRGLISSHERGLAAIGEPRPLWLKSVRSCLSQAWTGKDRAFVITCRWEPNWSSCYPQSGETDNNDFASAEAFLEICLSNKLLFRHPFPSKWRCDFALSFNHKFRCTRQQKSVI